MGFPSAVVQRATPLARRGFKGAARQALSAVRELKAKVSVRHGGVDEWAVGVWLELKHRVLGVTRLDGHCIDVGLRLAFGAIAECTQRRRFAGIGAVLTNCGDGYAQLIRNRAVGLAFVIERSDLQTLLFG